MIPFVDLIAQHREIAADVREGWDLVLNRAAFILGDEVRQFEESFAAYSGVGHCVGVASGTDAIELALRACGVGPGHEVVVPVNSFTASALAVIRAGATPVFVDVDRSTLLMDVGQVSDRIGGRTRALLPVHLFGQMAPMEDLRRLADDHGLIIVEDAAQAQGARRNGVGVGGFSRAAATSFYPGKNLGAYGDGGAVLTDDPAVARDLRALRHWGGDDGVDYPDQTFNSRLDTLQAVVLSAKLRRLDAWNDSRRQAAARYDQLLDGAEGIVRPTVLAGNTPVWHIYAVRVGRRDQVLAQLKANGIGASVHYPVPIHLQRSFVKLGYSRGDFPVAETAADGLLSLPMFPGITLDQQQQVVSGLTAALGQSQR
jgi:dTDP-4-amino-4,6-dideoxygalactose transaminase